MLSFHRFISLVTLMIKTNVLLLVIMLIASFHLLNLILMDNKVGLYILGIGLMPSLCLRHQHLVITSLWLLYHSSSYHVG